MRTFLSEYRRHTLAMRLPLLVLFLSFTSATYATDNTWTNTGIITSPPSIDAITVVNSGRISFSTDQPFETSNTENFTNSGTISTAPGWFFNNAPTTIGDRKMSANFVNQSGGSIESLDGSLVLFSGLFGSLGGVRSTLWVSATNIVNRGVLTVGASGWLKLAGTNVNLARGGVEVTAIIPRGSFNGITVSNFIGDAGIEDYYWGTTNVALPPGVPTATIWDGSIARAPGHDVTVFGGFPARQSFAIPGDFADSFGQTNGFIVVTVTNLVGLTNLPAGPTVSNIYETNIVVETIFVPTNITHQAAFIGVSDPNTLVARISWLPSSSFTNVFKTPQVELVFTSDNNVTGSQEANSIFIYDTLASEEPRDLLLANIASAQNLTTYRPTNYIVSRLQLANFGLAGDGYPDPRYLFDSSTFSNRVTTADVAGYGAFVENVPATPPIHPAATYTNLGGRVQIYAENLDLTKTRMRGQGQITINAQNLVGSSGAVIDCANLGFNLASTNGELKFENLAGTSVSRLQGYLYLYSAMWQNVMTLQSQNWNVTTNFDTNGVVTTLDATLSPITNSCDVALAATLINGLNLVTTLPVFVWDLKLLNPKVTINDNMRVVNTFYCDAKTLVNNGSISFTDGSWEILAGTVSFQGLTDIGSTNIPNVLDFTNNGSFTSRSSVHFGDDRPTPFNSFENNGSINSFSINVASTYFHNRGTLTSTGPLRVVANSAYLENGSSIDQNTYITSDTLRMNGYQLTSSGPLTLEVASLLTDAGAAGSPNLITISNGVQVAPKPASGDLLATSLQSVLRAFSQTDHLWPGSNRGATAAGFTNNVALGKLGFTLGGQDPLAFFAGIGGDNALYVDQLNLTSFGANYRDLMEIAPGFTIYYASAKLSFTPPPAANGLPQTPEEYLDGQFDGRLRWVSDYAGTYSSVAVVDAEGKTVLMNAALRNSHLIDSDNDGLPNYFDTTPLGGTSVPPVGNGLVLSPSFVNPGSGTKTFGISWDAAPNAAYRVEVATDLAKGDWQLLSNFTNTATIGKRVTVTDPAAAKAGQRFYRIRLQP